MWHVIEFVTFVNPGPSGASRGTDKRSEIKNFWQHENCPCTIEEVHCYCCPTNCAVGGWWAAIWAGTAGRHWESEGCCCIMSILSLTRSCPRPSPPSGGLDHRTGWIWYDHISPARLTMWGYCGEDFPLGWWLDTAVWHWHMTGHTWTCLLQLYFVL